MSKVEAGDFVPCQLPQEPMKQSPPLIIQQVDPVQQVEFDPQAELDQLLVLAELVLELCLDQLQQTPFQN